MIFKKLAMALSLTFVFWFARPALAQSGFFDGGISTDKNPSATAGIISVEGGKTIFPQVFFGGYSQSGKWVWFAGGGFGVRSGKQGAFLEGTFGAAYISRTTNHLGTHLQFRSAAFAGWATNKANCFRFGIEHFSNGGSLFGLPGPNHGENFLTLGTGFPLK